MAMRINGAKNFKGQSYATENYADGLITALKQTGKEVFLDTLLGTKGNENEIAMYDSTGVFKSTGYTLGVTAKTNYGAASKLATEVGTKAYVDDAISTVSAAAISISGENGIKITGDGSSKTIGNTFKLVKKSTANTGFAASYQLMYVTGGAGTTESPYTYGVLNGSDDINIVKDQFLKKGSLVWGTAADLDSTSQAPTGESATKTATAIYPFVKLELYTNEESAGSTTTSTIYIPANDLFRDYTAAANATEVQLAISNGNEISASIVGIASTKIGYKDAEGTVGQEGYKAAVSVKAALDDIYTQLGSSGSVATQITTAIEGLDVSDTAVSGQYVSQVSEADGKISVTRATLPVASVTFDSTTLKIQSKDGAATPTATDVVNLTPFKTAIEKAVQIVEATYILTTSGGTVSSNVSVSSGVVTVTSVPGRVLAVFDADGKQVYPEITYTAASGNTAAFSTLVADYGESTVDATWTVLHTAAIAVSFS